MTRRRLTTFASLAVLGAVLAPPAALAGPAPERSAHQMWRDRQQLPEAGSAKAPTARTGQAEPAAAHEGRRRHRTAVELVRARQQLPAQIRD